MPISMDPPPGSAGGVGGLPGDGQPTQADPGNVPVAAPNKAVDQGGSAIVRQSGDPSVDTGSQTQGLPPNHSPVIPGPQARGQGGQSGGGGTGTQTSPDGTTTTATTQAGPTPAGTQTLNRLAGNLNVNPTTQNLLVDGAQQTLNATPADSDLSALVQADKFLAELTAQQDGGHPEVTAKLLGMQGDMAGVKTQLENGEITPEEAKAKIETMKEEVGKVLADIEKDVEALESGKAELAAKNKLPYSPAPKSALHQQLEGLDKSLATLVDKFSHGVEVKNALSEQWGVLKDSGAKAKQMLGKLMDNIDSDPNLNTAQKDVAKKAIQGWKGLATGALPTLAESAPALHEALKLSLGNNSTLVGNLLNSGLLKAAPGTTAKGTTKAGPDMTPAQLKAKLGKLPAEARFRVAVNYMATMAKILSFIAEMKAKINALDAERLQQSAEVDKEMMVEKNEAAYRNIQKQLDGTTARQRAEMMKNGMKALQIIIAALVVVLAIVMCFQPFTTGVVAGILAIIAAVIAVFMLIFELISTIVEETTGKGIIAHIATAAGNPEAAGTAKMIFGAVMAVASIGTAIGAGLKLGAQGAALAVKLAGRLGTDVVQGVSVASVTAARSATEISRATAVTTMSMTDAAFNTMQAVAQEIIKQTTRTIMRQVIGGAIQNALPTAIALALPSIIKAITEAMPDDDEDSKMIIAMMLSILMMIVGVVGARVAGGAIGGNVSAAGGLATGASEATKGMSKAGQMLTNFKTNMVNLLRNVGTADESLKEGLTGLSKMMRNLGQGAQLFAATAGLTSGIMGIEKAKWDLKAQEAELESEVIEGLMDIIKALRGTSQNVKKGILDDLEHGINELLQNQHNINTKAGQQASEASSRMFNQ